MNYFIAEGTELKVKEIQLNDPVTGAPLNSTVTGKCASDVFVTSKNDKILITVEGTGLTGPLYFQLPYSSLEVLDILKAGDTMVVPTYGLVACRYDTPIFSPNTRIPAVVLSKDKTRTVLDARAFYTFKKKGTNGEGQKKQDEEFKIGDMVRSRLAARIFRGVVTGFEDGRVICKSVKNVNPNDRVRYAYKPSELMLDAVVKLSHNTMFSVKGKMEGTIYPIIARANLGTGKVNFYLLADKGDRYIPGQSNYKIDSQVSISLLHEELADAIDIMEAQGVI